ncbi:GyrI-like domain-containing protein [Xanthobacter sp. V4C-4]|uniref:GyrI-like domain-containing protein n=1 Tax=Xanthobacter cornucopiae TaxID=3119924 RepID=UPI00372BF333
MSARAAHDASGTLKMFNANASTARRRMALALALAAPLMAAPGARAQPAPPAAAAQKDEGLTPPPVVDPKIVETKPVEAKPQEAKPAAAALAPEELTLTPVPVLTLSGTATWEEAYDKLVAAMKTLDKELARLGLARAGDAFVVYTSSDDLGFEFEAQVPFSGTTTGKPGGAMKLGGSYAGKVLKFTHSGAFADMDNTYEQIANYLDEKNVTADDLYVERYRTDLATAAPDALKIDILVPVSK